MQNELVLISKKPKTKKNFYFLLSIPILLSILTYMVLNNFSWFNIKDFMFLIAIFSFSFYIYIFFKEFMRKKYRFKLRLDGVNIYLYEMKREKCTLIKQFKIEELTHIIYDKRHLEKIMIKKGKEHKISYVSRPSYIFKFQVNDKTETIYLSRILFDKDMVKLISDYLVNNNHKFKCKI